MMDRLGSGVVGCVSGSDFLLGTREGQAVGPVGPVDRYGRAGSTSATLYRAFCFPFSCHSDLSSLPLFLPSWASLQRAPLLLFSALSISFACSPTRRHRQ
jgi:hypothetical protein